MLYIFKSQIQVLYKKQSIFYFLKNFLQVASKIKFKKANKKRMVTVRRVNIFLNISRHPLLT
jgi:hypothetical protein